MKKYIITGLCVLSVTLALGASATKNYNSSKSNTSGVLQNFGIPNDNISKIIEGLPISINENGVQEIAIDEDKLKENLTEYGVDETTTDKILEELYQSAIGRDLIHEDAAALLQEENISFEDLGVEKPRLLPTNRFYFLKSWSRGIQRLFTFNQVKRAELELRFTDEKLAEAKIIAETNPEETGILERAIENYQSSQERLKTHLETLQNTSKNPNIEKLLEKLADRTIKHEKLFDELLEKTTHDIAMNAIRNIKARIAETASVAAEKDGAETFARRVEKALAEARGGDFRHVRSLEVLDKLTIHAEGELKEKLKGMRKEFVKRLEGDFSRFVEDREEDTEEVLRDTLERLPGDRVRRLEILKEVRENSDERIQRAFDKATDAIEDFIETHEDKARRAEEAVQHAREIYKDLQKVLERITNVPSAILEHQNNAREHLGRAEKALAGGKFGEAFGQARSAETLARATLRQLERDHPEESDLKEDIQELEEVLREWELKIDRIDIQYQEKTRAALENARLHLRLAGETFEQDNFQESKKHLDEAEEFERRIERIIHDARRGDRSPSRPSSTARPDEKPIACPMIGITSCEKNRSSDECRRAARELAEKYPDCGFEDSYQHPDSEDAPAESPESSDEILCIEIYQPVCGVDGRTYSNSCYAKRAEITIKHEGKCQTTLSPVNDVLRPIEQIEEPSRSEPVAPKDAEPIRQETHTEPAEETKTVTTAPKITEFSIEADDNNFHPSNTLTVSRGSAVRLKLIVRKDNVYFAGLRFQSPKFKTKDIGPGESTVVEFVADEPFTITSYWPSSGVRKADLKILLK